MPRLGCYHDRILLTLPMESHKHNALQRCSTIVVQNSLREGVSLTATEAKWEAAAVMGTSACGGRQQIRDGVHGRLVQNPDDPQELAALLDEMRQHTQVLEHWRRNGQWRVHNAFLVFTRLSRGLSLLAAVVAQ